MLLEKNELIQLQICQKDILKLDVDIKAQIENLKTRRKCTQKEVSEQNRGIKQLIAELGHEVNALERFANKMKSKEDRAELLAQIAEHRSEMDRNRQALRMVVLSLMKAIDEESRNFLFLKSDLDEKDMEMRNRMRRTENIKKESMKATESLSSLVSRMSDQVKLSEETTNTLIHSSAVIKETEGEFGSMASHIQSGGKLISKYGRRECTDRILITVALLLYVIVIMYILHKRVLKILF